MKKPSVYDFIDYRAFLKESFAFLKSKDADFSHAVFCRDAGIKSPSVISSTFSGRIDIGHKIIEKFARGLKLRTREKAFFRSMVFYTQAKMHEDKNSFYEEMMALKYNSEKTLLETARFDFWSKWYFPVIKALIGFSGEFSAKELASLTEPQITPGQARKAVKALEGLGYIKKTKSGKWERVYNEIDTESEVEFHIIANYHKQTLDLARTAIDRFPRSERHIAGKQLTVNKQTIKIIKDKIEAFRDELTELAENISDADRVFYINFSAFPLTKPIPKGGESA